MILTTATNIADDSTISLQCMLLNDLSEFLLKFLLKTVINHSVTCIGMIWYYHQLC